jgi:hypothetical protein
MGYARDAWGGEAMFAVGLAALIAVLASWFALIRIQKYLTSRAKHASEDRGLAA